MFALLFTRLGRQVGQQRQRLARGEFQGLFAKAYFGRPEQGQMQLRRRAGHGTFLVTLLRLIPIMLSLIMGDTGP